MQYQRLKRNKINLHVNKIPQKSMDKLKQKKKILPWKRKFWLLQTFSMNINSHQIVNHNKLLLHYLLCKKSYNHITKYC